MAGLLFPKRGAGALPLRRRGGKRGDPLLALTLPIAAVFSITLLAAPRLGGGWFWDAGNALGFLAFAGLLVQMIPARGARGLPAHERLGYAVLAVAVAHAFWFLLGDGTVRVYLQPDAPLHMLLGLGGLLILAVLTILARMPDRLRLHADYRAFRRTHRMLGLLAAGGAAGHVLLSRFYLSTWLQAVLFALLALALCFWRSGWPRPPLPAAAPVRAFLAVGTLAAGLFALLRNLPS